ncbi:hypothetical protein F5883DRAFT_236044 [Diaporthe sp. PMI_573]|nr:hypothetical protein F5883DRAFT_236044 [Diaporthaceae sp. PMI_573]
MAFPGALLAPSTWRTVGLGLTTTVFSLGVLSIVAPVTAADSLGVVPTTPEGYTMAQKATTFLGIRDLAVGGALYWFYYEGKQREMGILLTMWTTVCVVDTWVAIDGPRGWDKGIWGLCGGALLIVIGGLGLLQSS